VPAANPDPLLPLTLQLTFVQIVAFPAILLIWHAAPHVMPVVWFWLCDWVLTDAVSCCARWVGIWPNALGCGRRTRSAPVVVWPRERALPFEEISQRIGLEGA
jgi:hypothetical protein